MLHLYITKKNRKIIFYQKIKHSKDTNYISSFQSRISLMNWTALKGLLIYGQLLAITLKSINRSLSLY